MKLLREYIREMLLTEVAKGPEDLPEDVYVRVRKGIANFEIFYSDVEGNQLGTGLGTLPVSGYVNIMAPGSSAYVSGASCSGAWVVVGSGANHGWGPLLYDVAMEVAGSAGLMADRSSLSEDAYNVWQVYMSRGDVQKKQLDTLDNELTPDDADNCGTETARQFDDMFDDYRSDEKKQALRDSPVMKVYTKGPTAIGGLESAGRLIRK